MYIPVGDGLVKPEALNKKAIQIINRVRDKLTGECVYVFTWKGHKISFSGWLAQFPVVLVPELWPYAANWSVSEAIS